MQPDDSKHQESLVLLKLSSFEEAASEALTKALSRSFFNRELRSEFDYTKQTDLILQAFDSILPDFPAIEGIVPQGHFETEEEIWYDFLVKINDTSVVISITIK